MKVIKKLEMPDAKFDLYFLGYDSPKAPSHGNIFFDREGLIELTHNYGTENDPNYKVNNGTKPQFSPLSIPTRNTNQRKGNRAPDRGFGHTCISVDNLQAACKRIEDAGYRFQKKLTDGRMRSIAFVLDPDDYWVEVIGQRPIEETEDITTTDPETYLMNHTMIRVKDAEKSLKFYTETLGMTLLRTAENKEAGFNLYFLGYEGGDSPADGKVGNSTNGKTANREGVLELTWNYGTEKEEGRIYHDGNSPDKEGKQGFGHICVSVDSLEAACERFEERGVEWKKRPSDGRMKNVAFLLDPDGYWVEVVENLRISGKEFEG